MHTELHSVHDMMEQLKARMEKVIQGAAGIEVDDETHTNRKMIMNTNEADILKSIPENSF